MLGLLSAKNGLVKEREKKGLLSDKFIFTSVFFKENKVDFYKYVFL